MIAQWGFFFERTKKIGHIVTLEENKARIVEYK